MSIEFGKTVSLLQVADLIMHNPDVRFFLEGEPGIGKSSIMGMLKKSQLLADYHFAYVDVPNLDLGDIGLPCINHETQTSAFYPNELFGLQTGKPLCIMLDEFTKGMDPVKNMLHPLLEEHNPRLGVRSLPAGSIVFATGNIGSDGVGDTIKAHSLNRLTRVRVRKPTADEWLKWASLNNVNPVVLAWVDQFKHALASYLDDGNDSNPYIYNPRKTQTSFVSPRSLVRASKLIDTRHTSTADATICALSGTLGESAARDIQAYVEYQDQLPHKDEVLKNPKGCVVPTSPGACAVMAYSMVEHVDKGNIDPLMEYVSRMSEEWQAIFIVSVARREDKKKHAFSNLKFQEWILENADLL